MCLQERKLRRNISCLTVEFLLSKANNHPQQPTVVCSFLDQEQILRYPDKPNYFCPCHKCSRQAIGYVAPKADDTQDVGREEDVEESSK